MDINIYSEPLFPISQGWTSPSSSCATGSVGPTQQVLNGEAKVAEREDVEERKENCCSTPALSGLGLDINEQEDDVDDSDKRQEENDSEADEKFCLESLIVRAISIKQNYCSVGCPSLNEYLRGGIPMFGITEFYGEAGTGKSQLCLQLAITAQLPNSLGGLESGVFFICTEGGFPTKRLTEIVQYFRTKYPNDLPEDVMNNIFIEHASDFESLAYCTEVKLPRLALQHPSKKIRMVILDSVAGIFRYEYDDLTKRTVDLRQLAQNLHEFSHDHQAAIVCCNQVTACPNLERNIASLGIVWKNMVTTRIRFSKGEVSNKRNLLVNFSPHIPSTEIPFEIFSGGMRAIVK